MPTPLDGLAGVTNAYEALPDLYTGGQPSARHLEALRDTGVETILDIRDPLEARPFDEPATARALGLNYVNVPVSAGVLNDETLERVLGVVRAHEGKRLFFHCASANRVGGALIPYLMMDRGMSQDDAVSLAMRVGLRGADLLEWGLEYARRKLAGE